MVAQGMKPRQILLVFPELSLDDVRNAVLQAADLMRDPESSLPPADADALELLRKAQRNSDLSEEEAMELAVAETRAYRREKASRR